MQEIFLNGKSVTLPENWTEVQKTDLPVLLRLLYVLPENGSTYHEVIRILLGYSPKQWAKLMRKFFGKKRNEEQRNHSANAMADLLRLMDWMWKADLTKAPWNGFWIDGQKWLLFEEGFKSMSFGELVDAHINAQAFIKQLVEGDDRLNLLVATLCRPERAGDYQNDPEWNGDPREPYNEHITRHRSEVLKDGYTEEKVLTLMYFLGTLKEFFSFYDIFESDSSGPAREEEYPGQNMIKNQHLLSEKHIFGGMKATKTANVHEVFQFLEENHKDIKEKNEQIAAQNQENQ